jgi:hypothetical protein
LLAGEELALRKRGLTNGETCSRICQHLGRRSGRVPSFQKWSACSSSAAIPNFGASGRPSRSLTAPRRWRGARIPALHLRPTGHDVRPFRPPAGSSATRGQRTRGTRSHTRAGEGVLWFASLHVNTWSGPHANVHATSRFSTPPPPFAYVSSLHLRSDDAHRVVHTCAPHVAPPRDRP